VTSWQKGVEIDIDEVLQIDTIFLNVSRGEAASSKDLKKCFGTADKDEVCRIILKQGQLQVGELERKAERENLLRDISSIIADKCVNPTTNRPYTFTVIQRMLKEIGFTVKENRNAKQQALDAIPELQNHMPLERKKMLLRLIFAAADVASVKSHLDSIDATVEKEQLVSAQCQIDCLIHPSNYRKVDEVVVGQLKGKLSIVDATVQQQGSSTVSKESERIEQRAQTNTTEQTSIFNAAATTSSAAGATGHTTSSVVDGSKGGGDNLKCTTAPGVSFASRPELMAHYKSEWHRHNLQRKTGGLPMLSKGEFEGMSKEQLEDGLAKGGLDAVADNDDEEERNGTKASAKSKGSKKKKTKKAKKQQEQEEQEEDMGEPEKVSVPQPVKKGKKKKYKKNKGGNNAGDERDAGGDGTSISTGGDVAEADFDHDFFGA
jgi:ribosome maturation protein SDO1